MSGIGKVFRMAKVPAKRNQIDMRYSKEDGMWYPSQPAPLASGMKTSFESAALYGSTPTQSCGKGKDIFVIICDNDENTSSINDEKAEGDRRNSESQGPIILILDVDSVQDPSGNHTEVESSPKPPTDVYDPLSAERSVPMEWIQKDHG